MSKYTLQAEHTVGVHCSPARLITQEGDNGELIPVGVSHEAFIPDDDGVSVSWVEHPHHQSPKQDSMIRCLVSNRRVKATHRAAVLKVGAIIQCGSKMGQPLQVEHDPYEDYECHSLIKGLNDKNTELQGLIATGLLSLEVMIE